jgi:hypothetical protein
MKFINLYCLLQDLASHSRVIDDSGLLGRYSVPVVKQLPTFQKTIAPSLLVGR